ncbi:MAG: hypothetical protein K9N51_09400, partial [Candidatus Pacebacteria bacterium]|nr:hypothetical protein [Candidatus Paceibacterota bacterium]
MVRKTAFTTTAALMGLVPGLDAIPMVTESLEGRIRVLYVADQGPHRNYPQLDLLERHTDLRFIYQRNSSPAARGNDESAAVCDGLLWDSAGFPAQQTQRIERLAGYLERRHFDMLVLEGKDHLPRIQDAIVAYVKDGGTLVWLGTNLPRQLKRADSDAPETSQALNELCPWRKDDEAVAKQKAAKVRSLVRKGTRIGLDVLEQTHPLVCGFPLDAMLGHRNRPTPALLPKQDTACLAQWQTTEHGVLGVMSVGKGRVIGITTGSLVPPSHTMGNWGRIDREMLWLRFWQHLGRVVKHGDNANPTRLSVTTGEETVQSGDSFPVTLQAFGLPGGRQ